MRVTSTARTAPSCALLVALLLAAACRGRFDEIRSDANDDAVGDGLPAETTVEIVIVGRGAVVGAPDQACADHCTFAITGPTTFTAVADEGAELVTFDGACGTQPTCTISGGTTLTATFAQSRITANRAFVSSTVAPTSSGLAALDAHCQGLATAAGLSGTFVALVSTSTTNARDRLTGSRGWVRLDGLPIIDQVADFGTQAQPRGIALDELGTVHSAELIVTGSFSEGQLSPGTTCGDWTNSTGGNGGFSDAAAILMLGGVGTGCGTRVYCFETGKTVAVVLHPTTPFPAGRYVFLADGVSAGTGITGADARCQNDATAAGLPGTYKAVLATTTSSALAHVGDLSGTWRRPDGIVVTRGGLDQGPYVAAITAHADGTPYVPFLAELGAAGLTSLGTSASTCNDWTAPASTTGSVYYPVLTPFTQITMHNCDWPVMCAQTGS